MYSTRLTLCAAVAAMLGASAAPPRQEGAPPQGPAHAQGAAPQQGATPQEHAQRKGFVLQEGEHDIADLIARSAAFLHRNYLVDWQGVPADKVTLQNRLDLDEQGCEEVVSALLYTKGLVMTPLDRERGVWEWINVNGPKRGEITARATPMTPAEVRKHAALRIAVSTMLPLQHIRASAATNALRPFFLPASNGVPMLTIGNVGNDTALLLQGFADNVATAIRLVESADVPNPQQTKPLEEWMAKVDQRLEALEAKLK